MTMRAGPFLRGVEASIPASARAALLLSAALLSPLGEAADLQISQIADRAPDLAVFVTGSGLPTAARTGPQGAALSAALGSAPLRVRSSVPWEASQGITLVVALDVSASLRPADFTAIKQALSSVLASLPSDSRVALLSIGTDVATVMPFAKPAEIVGGPLDGLAPDARQTALYEALLTSQQLASTAAAELPLRRVVLVLTDGIDDSPRGFSADEALKKISSGDAPVFALALAPPRPNATQRAAIRSLAQIARASGGAYVQSTASSVDGSLKALLAQATKAQLVTLDCASCERDGVVRNLQVSLRQGNVATTDTREIRLPLPLVETRRAEPTAPVASVSAPPAEPIATPVVERKPPPDTSLQPWSMALIALVVVAFIGLLVWLKKRSDARRGDATGNATTIDNGFNDAADPAGDVDGLSTTTAAATTVPASKPSSTGGQLVTLDVSGQGRMQIRVDASDVVLGRAKTAAVSIERDSEASTRHAALVIANGALMLRDLGSANGTYLNGTKIVRPEPLHDRDVVLIGRTEVRVYLGNG